MVRCVYPGCNKVQNSKTEHSFFTFPKDPIRSNQWLSSIGLTEAEINPKNYSLRICGSHFPEKMFLNFYKSRLHTNAIPFQYNKFCISQEVISDQVIVKTETPVEPTVIFVLNGDQYTQMDEMLVPVDILEDDRFDYQYKYFKECKNRTDASTQNNNIEQYLKNTSSCAIQTDQCLLPRTPREIKLKQQCDEFRKSNKALKIQNKRLQERLKALKTRNDEVEKYRYEHSKCKMPTSLLKSHLEAEQ